MLGYGAFVTAIISFLLMAFVIFQIVRAANNMMPAKPEAPAAPAGPSEVDLLIEIRDALRELPSTADASTLLRDALKLLGARRA